MQDLWLNNRADEIQSLADINDMKNFYNGLNEIYSPILSGSSLLSADGSTLITDRGKIPEERAEHFNNALNRPSTINNDATCRLPQVPIIDELNATPTVEEILKAISLQSSVKKPGSDYIPAEV